MVTLKYNIIAYNYQAFRMLWNILNRFLRSEIQSFVYIWRKKTAWCPPQGLIADCWHQYCYSFLWLAIYRGWTWLPSALLTPLSYIDFPHTFANYVSPLPLHQIDLHHIYNSIVNCMCHSINGYKYKPLIVKIFVKLCLIILVLQYCKVIVVGIQHLARLSYWQACH